MDTFPLNENINIPVLGFGTWGLHGQECIKAVNDALEIGYRLFDTADMYNNHREIAGALNESGIPRDELFITTKLWPNELKRENVLNVGKRFLEELETDYIDLLLIHWPNPEVRVSETLGAMNKLKEAKIINTIGVSNFNIKQLQEALETGIEIVNNQVEYHPTLAQPELKKFCDEHGILLTAYSPLARGEEIKIDSILNIAENYQRPPSQVIINWIIQKGVVAIPKASSKEHIEENFNTLEWQLSDEDIKEIDKLNTNNRIVSPSFFDDQ